MLTIQQVKTLYGDPNLTDQQAQAVLAAAQGLAELAIEVWKERRRNGRGLLTAPTGEQTGVIDDPKKRHGRTAQNDVQ